MCLMSLVSYAQNFEDVMLWRALKHIEKGFYVDVGAQHPVVDSVSKAFYEHGWRGIHIEPVPQYAELLRKDRPDETVLQVALADIDGTLELNVIPDTGLSTCDDAYAQLHQLARNYEHHRIQVPVLTLKSALRSLGDKEVHWLKIDVEGFEEKVLKGWDSRTVRPWIIVVEATIPGSPETNYASWDPILTSANYQFVYFDGLNRFYVSNEHAELAGAFSCPPNVFDGVRLSGFASSEFCRGLITSHQTSEKQLVAQIENLTTDLSTANAQNASARERESQLEVRAQWLQSEWDTTKQQVEALSQRTGRLEGDLESERRHKVLLNAELQGARGHTRRLQAHVEWLQRQWDAAKAKINELNESSHQVGQELESVYASKSWRITWPLRKTMQGAKQVLAWLMVTLQWVLRVPTHMRKAPFESSSYQEDVVEIEHPEDTGEKSISDLSPHAAHIYADLKKAIDTRKS